MSGDSEHKTMNLTLIVWRQNAPNEPGRFETLTARNITEHHSFLESHHTTAVLEELASLDTLQKIVDWYETNLGRMTAVESVSEKK